MTTCFNCPAEAEHDHHVVPRSLGGVATVPLCVSCHGKAHGRSRAFRSTGELTKAALAAKKARGERIGTVSYGFTADTTGLLVECPAEQAVIAQVRTLRATGLSQRGIVAELARVGIVGRTGRALALLQVQHILADNKHRPTCVSAKRTRERKAIALGRTPLLET